ncbi:hypothetical protein D3C83_296150 [compost metagenome]
MVAEIELTDDRLIATRADHATEGDDWRPQLAELAVSPVVLGLQRTALRRAIALAVE